MILMIRQEEVEMILIIKINNINNMFVTNNLILAIQNLLRIMNGVDS